jgi:1,4-alpha-glucan branching enzyme
MKKIILFLFLGVTALSLAQTISWQGGVNPEQSQSGTILFNKTGTPLASYSGVMYAHIGVTLNGISWQNVIGDWGNNTVQPTLTLVSGTTYKLDLTPSIMAYFGVSSGTITKVNVVFRNAAGTAQTTNLELNVGAFQGNLVTPSENSTTILSSGQNLSISATSTQTANFNLYKNGTLHNSNTGIIYNFTDVSLVQNANYDLQITNGATTISKKFSAVVVPSVISEAIPANVVDGINYHSTDATKATLVLDAPGKDFVYVAGSFNNWMPTSAYAMKKDPSSTKFWLELTGLVSGQIETYQYWVVSQTPAVNSPRIVKTADPYSTLVLSPFDDPYIPTTTYPNLPTYPAGQEREVTVLQTGKMPYNWQVTNFVKPLKEDLVVYEVLIRDFDVNRNIQDLINKMEYFKNLKVNAIQLMPVMEFEGNESWGYNTSFHLALDKFYGTENKLKEFVDLCHQNGMAVILDVALNHAFGRNPMVRMWMKDADGDGWGDPATDNPYFNETPRHSYNVGSDFNHQSTLANNYVKRVVKHWIEEFKIDGFRWDLTKGFTQNCAGSGSAQDNCTNGYQQDRVDVLKQYADYSWSLDNDHYVIFEHLGQDNEEQQWANYRIAEGKGVMMWGKMTNEYNQLSMGFNSNNNISRMNAAAHGFTGKRVMGYAESHDEERLMYKNLMYGNMTNMANHNVRDLNVALSRMSAVNAMSVLVPGPKMIWHFGELGWEKSIFTCQNGSVNTDTDPTAGDCKLDTKPQPQWTENWMTNANRVKIYNDLARMIELKRYEPVFKGNVTINSGTTLQPKMYLSDESQPELKNVVILSNFDVTTQNVIPNFPYIGTWYDLMDNTSITVTNGATPIAIPAGQFRIFGNAQALLNTNEYEWSASVSVSPNPANDYFSINAPMTKVEIISITGQKVKAFTIASTSDTQFYVGDLNKGVYLVKASDDNNRQKTMKLVKQ